MWPQNLKQFFGKKDIINKAQHNPKLKCLPEDGLLEVQMQSWNTDFPDYRSDNYLRRKLHIWDKFSKFYKNNNEIKDADDILVNKPCIEGRYTRRSVQSPCTNEQHPFICLYLT